MIKHTFTGFFLLTFLFISILSNYAMAHSTLSYSYLPTPNNLSKCKSKAKQALINSGYRIYTVSSARYVGGTKGEFRTLITCEPAAKSGIAFIIINGNKTDPVKAGEISAINRNFLQAK